MEYPPSSPAGELRASFVETGWSDGVAVVTKATLAKSATPPLLYSGLLSWRGQ